MQWQVQVTGGHGLLQSILVHRAVWGSWMRCHGVYKSIDQPVLRKRWTAAECVTCFCKIIAKSSVIHLQDCQGQHVSICVSVDMFLSVLACESLSVFVYFPVKIKQMRPALTGSSYHICSASFSQQHRQKHQHIPVITKSSIRKHIGWSWEKKKNRKAYVLENPIWLPVLAWVQPIINPGPDLPD